MTTDSEDDSVGGNVTTGAFDNLPPAAAADSSPEEYIRLWKWKEKNKRSRQSGDILHESWVTLLRVWMSWCVEHHRECSRRELDSLFSDSEDILLIDTGRLCLVKAQTNFRDIALSYVWGSTPHLTTITTTKSIEKFLEPDALLHIWEKLPRVVQEAIDLTDRIGERFLWVDCLCIVQDDTSHLGLGRQLKLMAEIYYSASATFIACAGDHADVRLVPPTLSAENNWPRSSANLYDRQISRPKPPQAKSLLAAISASTHSGRGWTYQEKLLSRRCLYFLNDRIIYRCRADMFVHDGADMVSEEEVPHKWWYTMTCTDAAIDAEEERHKYHEAVAKKVRQRRFLSEWPRDMLPTDWDRGFKFWADMVQEYSQQKFKFESDVLDACSGVLTAFQRYSGWHILQECPEPLLDYALLWIPQAGGEARNLTTMESPFPTWSWLGWKGGVHFGLASCENKLCEYQNQLWYLHIFGQKIESMSTISDAGCSSSQQVQTDTKEEKVTFNNSTEGTHFSGSSLRLVAEHVPALVFLHKNNEELPPGDVSHTFAHSVWLNTSYSSQICGILYGVDREAFRILKTESTDTKLFFILLSDIRLTRFKSVNWKLAFETIDTDLRNEDAQHSRIEHDIPQDTAVFDGLGPLMESGNDYNDTVRPERVKCPTRNDSKRDVDTSSERPSLRTCCYRTVVWHCLDGSKARRILGLPGVTLENLRRYVDGYGHKSETTKTLWTPLCTPSCLLVEVLSQTVPKLVVRLSRGLYRGSGFYLQHSVPFL